MLIFKARVRQQSVCVGGGDSMFLLLLLCGKLQFSNILYMHDHLLEKRSWKLTLTTSNLISNRLERADGLWVYHYTQPLSYRLGGS